MFTFHSNPSWSLLNNQMGIVIKLQRCHLVQSLFSGNVIQLYFGRNSTLDCFGTFLLFCLFTPRLCCWSIIFTVSLLRLTIPGWRLREIQRWSALIQNTFRSVSALFITWKSLNSADSALNRAENGNFHS